VGVPEGRVCAGRVAGDVGRGDEEGGGRGRAGYIVRVRGEEGRSGLLAPCSAGRPGQGPGEISQCRERFDIRRTPPPYRYRYHSVYIPCNEKEPPCGHHGPWNALACARWFVCNSAAAHSHPPVLREYVLSPRHAALRRTPHAALWTFRGTARRVCADDDLRLRSRPRDKPPACPTSLSASRTHAEQQ
jgi:hypothetical protein